MATLIYYDESAFNAALTQAQYLADHLTNIVSQFAAVALPTPAPIVTADLPGLLADPYAWLLNRYLGNAPLLLGGVPVNAHKVFESGLVDKPAGFDAFVTEATKGRTWLASSQAIGPMREAASYVVAADGTVSFSAAAQLVIQNRFKYYTSNAKQDALLTDLMTVRDVVNRLLTTGALYAGEFDKESFLKDAFVRSGAGQVRVNPDYILKRFNY